MQNTKAVLAVDFDDVVAGFNRAYLEFHNALYGPPYIAYEQVVTFDMPALYGVEMDVVVRRVRAFCHNHHDSILPCLNVHEDLARLAENHNLHIVTSRCESLLDITHSWLQQHHLSEYFVAQHFTNGFGSRYPDRRVGKLAVCQEIGAIALIDDAPVHAQGVADGGIVVYMPQRPWNATFSHQNVRTIKSLAEIPM